MVYPHEHLLIRFHGHFGASGSVLDKWSASVRFGHPSSAPAYDPAKLQTFVNACATAGRTFMAATATDSGTNAFLDYASGAQIGVLGQYTPTTQLTIVSPSTPTPGVSTGVMPWNTASVISLRTDNPRGRASNGRMYWPMLGAQVVPTTGRVGVTTRLAAAKAFFDSMNTAANAYSTGMRAIVASNVGGGLIAFVTHLRADDRLDSIERRENDQPPNYVTQTLA